jgi:hypothetical protein
MNNILKMNFSSESSGEENNERRYWKYIKAFKKGAYNKSECESIQEEDLSCTEFNASAIKDLSLNLVDLPQNSSSDNKSSFSGSRGPSDYIKKNNNSSYIFINNGELKFSDPNHRIEVVQVDASPTIPEENDKNK